MPPPIFYSLSYQKPYWLLIWLCCSTILLAHDNNNMLHKKIAFENISQQEGLSSNVVYSGLKDSRGFIWFGTSKGLNRFDGLDIHRGNSLRNA